VWVNRGGVPEEELGAHPEVIAKDFSGLIEFVGKV
jgi:hypothetical protein